MSKQTRRSYDKSFKQMAVELYVKGKSAADVSKDLGIGVDLVRRWAKEHSENGVRSFPGNGKQDLTAEQKEIQALKKALKESEMENQILKKAVGIFSREGNKYSGS